MKNVLCITNTLDDCQNFIKNAQIFFFQIEQLDPEEHSFLFFKAIYEKLKESTDLTKIDLIVAEYIEAVPLVYFMRRDGIFAPAIFIPHTNAYPLNILFYFLLVSHFSHPNDVVLCGSKQAARGYQTLTNIKALPICTFGIKSAYKKGDKKRARKELGLPEDRKLILYTGRFMNDKGLASLINISDEINKRVKNVTLLLSITHIDPLYYNSLAPKLGNSILFYRLEKEQMVYLYQSSDLFVSVATSIFETYGKSPLEAIACGVPVVLPKWDGFSYFVNEQNGSLAKCIYDGLNEDAPFSFAKVDEKDFANKCCEWLEKEDFSMENRLPAWAFYDSTMITLKNLVDKMLISKKFNKEANVKEDINSDVYPLIIQKIFSHYQLETWADIETKSEQLGLINRENVGNLELLEELHNLLFKTMDETEEQIKETLSAELVSIGE